MRTWLASVSLANLFLVRIWTELLGENVEAVPVHWYASALLNLALLTGLIWIIVRCGGPIGRVTLALLGAALLVKEFTLAAGEAAPWRGVAGAIFGLGMRQGWLWPAVLAALLALAWIARRTRIVWISSTLLVLSPIVLVTAVQACWHLVQPAHASAPVTRPTASTAAKPGPRVVWIIFDELDQRIAFSQRPAGIKLPALDDFRAEAVVFRNAASISSETVESVPAMLGNIFKLTHTLGFRSGLVGWHIPYCQIYGQDLDVCQRWRLDRQLTSYGDSLLPTAGHQLRSLLEANQFSPFGQSLAVKAHVRTTLEMEAAALDLASDDALNLVLLHLPVPHRPYVYDAARQDLTAANQGAAGYLPNLELADRIFARIRSRLVSSGLWEKSHVIVMGDHGFRNADLIGYPAEPFHVPFMWKPVDPVKPRLVQQKFQTSNSSQLVWRLLQGETAESILAGYP